MIRESLERNIGIDCLEGWRTARLLDGREIAVRAFGARSLHIIAGNSPVIAALTVMRNAVLRSDAIIKNPSNDPFTALAIARTMIDMAPDHPVTKHLSVAYWKGGDETIERELYHPRHIEKIVAWGGLASVRHVTKAERQHHWRRGLEGRRHKARCRPPSGHGYWRLQSKWLC
jgi:acyl-CoA reductase-like NAD-dependent aldehyde dehydrogenase